MSFGDSKNSKANSRRTEREPQRLRNIIPRYRPRVIHMHDQITGASDCSVRKVIGKAFALEADQRRQE